MEQWIYIGFKGKNNASSMLVDYLSEKTYLLTNSFGGVKRDIEKLAETYDYVLMFGVDKNLKNSVRIERMAEREGVCLLSDFDLDDMVALLKSFKPEQVNIGCNSNPGVILPEPSKEKLMALIHELREFVPTVELKSNSKRILGDIENV